MGMPILVDVRDEEVDGAALDGVFDWFGWVDGTFSTYKQDSEISRLDRGELASRMPRMFAPCSRAARSCAPRPAATSTRRLARARPSGLVKGWSVDRAAAILDEAGATNYAVNAGGDIRLRGGALPESGWRVGIQHPLVPTAWPRSSRNRRRGRHLGRVRALASTSSTRTRAARRPACSRSPSPAPSWRPPTPTRRPRSRWATGALDGDLEGYEALTILADGRVL